MSRKREKDACCHPTRRQILKMLGSASLAPLIVDPIQTLISGMVDGLITRAQAAELPPEARPRNHIFVGLPGGPPRWVFDLVLAGYDPASVLVRNPQVNTRFADNGGSAGLPVYATVPITRGGETLNMPALWGSTIPTSSGRTVPMAELLDHLLILRGINMSVDGHDTNYVKMLRPSSGAASLNGLVADHAPTPVPAVSLSSQTESVFRSLTGVGLASVDRYNDPLGSVLNSYDRRGDGMSASYLNRRQAMESVMSQALGRLGEFSRSSHPGAHALYEMRGKAQTLLRQGFGNLASEYQTLFAKYRKLITDCASTPIPGVTDRPISTAYLNANAAPYSMTRIDDDKKESVLQGDLRTLIQPDTSVSRLAETFAVAEYLVLGGYSTSVACGISSVDRVFFEQVIVGDNQATLRAVNGPTYHGFDEHVRGAALSLVFNSFLYRCLAACLYELISKLKERQLFGETVIQLGSEFSRSPKGGGSGSDHGWMANVVSLFSGAIDQPLVLGNIRSNGSGGYAGDWGVAAKVNVEGQDSELGIGHATSTIAHLLRVKPPLPNNSSLVQEKARGGVVPVIEKGRKRET